MTPSYVGVTALFLLLLEFLAVVLYILLFNHHLETSYLALAQRVGIQYAYAASLQSTGLALNPQTTFVPGQPYSLVPPGQRVPGENARGTLDTTNYIIPYITERSPAQPPEAVALLIAPDRQIVASSYPALYPSNTLFSHLPPQQASALSRALHGTSSFAYARTSSGVLYVAETVWGRNKQPIGAIYILAQVDFVDFAVVLHYVPTAWLPVFGLILLILVVTTPVGSLFSLLTTRGLVRRIRHLAAATTTFARGDHHQRVRITRQDEVGQLEYDFNAMADQLVESTHRLQELAGQDARLAERARISRELHDAISQDLFSLRLLAYGLQDALPEGSESQVQVTTLERTTRRVIHEMRALLLELRPTSLEQLGLAEALRDLVASYDERLEITVTSDIALVSLQPEAEHALLRVAQEALANAVRHANATCIRLVLGLLEHGVRLTVRDNGTGFVLDESQKQHGLGLSSMQERIRELHGTFTLQTAPGQGTEIVVELPREEESA